MVFDDQRKVRTSMNKMKELLEVFANDTSITQSNDKINQNKRNTMKRGFVEALYCDVKEALKELESVQVYRTSDGIALSIDNERVGMIPIVLDGMIKNLDYNAADEEDAYVEAQRAAAIKAEEAAALKARKIEESTRARAAKLAQKELERGKVAGS